MLATESDAVVGFAQLIRSDAPTDYAEASVLVEDRWQGRSVGSMLLSAVCETARRWGMPELSGYVLPSEAGFARLATHLGLPVAIHRESGRDRVAISLSEDAETRPPFAAETADADMRA